MINTLITMKVPCNYHSEGSFEETQRIDCLNLSTPILADITSWRADHFKNQFFELFLPHLFYLSEESFHIIPGSTWVSFLISSLSVVDLMTDTPVVDSALWIAQLECLTAKETMTLFRYFFTKPDILTKVPFGEALELVIKRYGCAKHTYTTFGKILMKMEGKLNSTIKLRSNHLTDNLSFLISFQETKEFPTLSDHDLINLTQTTQVLGRTLLTEHYDTQNLSKKWIAYKFLREKETLKEFCREKEMTNLFKRSGVFLSDFPTPMGIFSMKQIPEELKRLLPDNIVTNSPLVYVQQVPENYYVYLHEIENDQLWQQSRRKFLTDSAKEIAYGYIPLLADLYHYEEDERRYQPLVDLAPMHRLGCGAGHLDTPFKKVMWPNAGMTGIRDVGDGNHLKELIDNPLIEATDLMKLESGRMSYFLMNGLAKLSLVDTLLLIARFEKLGQIDWRKQEIVNSIAGALKEGQKWILNGFLGYDLPVCSDFVEALPINWTRQANELLFWTQTGKEGYAEFLEKGNLPEGIYDSKLKISIDLSEAYNFIPKQGFFSEGFLDFGCYGGPLGWIENEKGWNIISAIAVGSFYHEHADILENPQLSPKRNRFNFDSQRRKRKTSEESESKRSIRTKLF